MTLSVTAEFGAEFEAERTSWLRRRFLWYSGILSILSMVTLAFAVLVLLSQHATLNASDDERAWWFVGALAALELAQLLVFLIPFLYVRSRGTRFEHDSLINLVTGMIVTIGLLTLVSTPIGGILQSIIESDPGGSGPLNWAASWAAGVMVAHFIASLFIPWTFREALRPLAPLLGVAVAYVVFAGVRQDAPWWLIVLLVFLLPLTGAPGLLVSWWRVSRSRQRFTYRKLRGHYGQMKRELSEARRIHEELFPPPIEEGPVRFRYLYEPMRQIGGDYLFARTVVREEGAEPALDLILVDVTGHGLTAALTVNRLAGEIEREFGEAPDASPGEILQGLNAYLHLTLARHSVYATALCIRFDPNDNSLRWASAGHPPAFLCTADGRLDRLDSTTLLLGAARKSDFYPNEQKTRFGRGDVLLAYTDGATEATNADGRMLRVDGLQNLIYRAATAGGAGSIAEAVVRDVETWRSGPAQDDTLVVEVSRAAE